MKTMMKTGMMLLAVTLSQLAMAVGNGSLMGQVTDPDTQKPIDGANVVLDCKGSQVSFITNEKGFYYASNIPPCTYNVIVMYQGKTITYKDVEVKNDDVKELNASISAGITITGSNGEGVVVEAKRGSNYKPLIDKLNPTTTYVTKLELKEMPVLNLQRVIDIQPGVVEMDGQTYVHGSRADGLAYYIDGCKVTGNPNVPICGVQMMQIYTGYVPAKFGDTTAGVVAIETRNWFNE